ncbi:MAG: hypothetical protein FWF76_06795 [Oscillospiraceae bacterium]|nr:hypothetical protein [Oscillospiraceae bacterium]
MFFEKQAKELQNNYIELPDMADCHLYKQAGNSVSIPIIKIIAEGLAHCIKT